MIRPSLLLLSLAAAACRAPAPAEPDVLIAHLSRAGVSGPAQELARAFRANNPGYGLELAPALVALEPDEETRVVFVQEGEGRIAVTREGAPASFSQVGVGDVVIVRPGEALECEAPLAAAVFRSPVEPPAHVPSAIRPDWDPSITDTPGGCATETGAYRRILVTWRAENGPYVYHALNAHRVRITDSFTHYHPYVGGFDELYLVQMVQPGARILTSDAVAAIESPETVTREEAAGLFDEHPLAVGDLVYLPRGTIHRGLGGVLAQVITVPGFVPGAEIGVDHHLRAIDERLGLEGDAAVPYNAAAAVEAVVK